MSTQDETTIPLEIKRIRDNIANAYTSLEKKGASIPPFQTSDNLQSTIDTINVSSVSYSADTRTLVIKTS